jgi:polar amino acid transport system substrate-binding protein
MMLLRLPATLAVLLIVVAIGVLPSVAPRADAAPRQVTVATRDLTPFVMTQDSVRSGFTIDLLAEIAKHTDWRYTYLDFDNVKGLLNAVADGRADLGAAAVSITGERQKQFDFSQPMLNAGLQIIAPAGNTERAQPGLIDFLKLLFSKTMAVWLWTMKKS